MGLKGYHAQVLLCSPFEPVVGSHLIGNVLDKYEVLQKVGEGGMATVYRGRHVTLGREVAIKVLHPHLSASERNRQRFEREARAIENLDHDNILKIFDYSGSEADFCYIVTEFVDGETLQSLLRNRARIPSEVVALIGIRLAMALDYAHELGIIHRDLKLENVMIRKDGTVKLMDFGIARFLDEMNLTVTGALVGSPAYMSPEQAMERVLDTRSDLFSLGTLLFHLVTGQLPFTGSNPSIILRNIIEGNRPGVIELASDVSGQLADLIEQLLQIEPMDRPDSARDVATQLARCSEDAGFDPTSEPWSLHTWLIEPNGYEERLQEQLKSRLLERGKRLLHERDHLGALRMFNRLLSMDENNTEVLDLIRNMHGTEGGGRASGARMALAGLLVVFMGVYVWFAWPTTTESPTGTATLTEDGTDPRAPAPDEEEGEQGEEDILPSVVATSMENSEPVPDIASPPDANRAASSSPQTPAPTATPAQTRTAPDPPATVLVTVPGSWGDIYIDDELKGRTGTVGRIEVTSGTHKLGVRNHLAVPFEKNFTVAPGEDKVIEVTGLQRKPARFRLVDAPDLGCTVIVDGVRRGTIGSLSSTIRIRAPDRPHDLKIQCPDGTSITRTLDPVQPGALIKVPLATP